MRSTRQPMFLAVVAAAGLTACTDSPLAPADDAAAVTASVTAIKPSLRTAILGSDTSVAGIAGDTVEVTAGDGRPAGAVTSLSRFSPRLTRSSRAAALALAEALANARSTDSTVVQRLPGTAPRFVFRQPGRAGIVIAQARRADTIAVTVQSTEPESTRPIAPFEAEPAPVPAPSPVPSPAPGLSAFTAAELPRARVATALLPKTGRTITVTANSATSLQAAFDAAVPGDEIVLPDRAVFSGNFVLPARKAGTGRIIVRSATIPGDSSARVTPAAAANFARIVTPNTISALVTVPRASGWHFVGVEIAQGESSAETFAIVQIGTGAERTVADLPGDFVFDRVYIHSHPNGATRRCLALNGGSAAVVHSWLAECHHYGFDAQAIVSWGGAGPFVIEDNFLEGSGENVHFGGAPTAVPNVIPSDITIRRNHLYKPLAWRYKWLVKNSFEMKNAQRVLFEENFVENSWSHGQAGYALMVTASPEAAHSIVADVTIRNNIISNANGGIYILSRWPGITQPTRRVVVQNNVFEKVGQDPLSAGTKGRLIQLLGDAEDVTFVHNTFVGPLATNQVMLGGSAGKRLTFERNVLSSGEYGIWGDQNMGGKGMATFTFFFPGASVKNNVFFDGGALWANTSNQAPTPFSYGAFVNQFAGDWRLPANATLTLMTGGAGVTENLARVRTVRSAQ